MPNSRTLFIKKVGKWMLKYKHDNLCGYSKSRLTLRGNDSSTRPTAKGHYSKSRRNLELTTLSLVFANTQRRSHGNWIQCTTAERWNSVLAIICQRGSSEALWRSDTTIWSADPLSWRSQCFWQRSSIRHVLNSLFWFPVLKNIDISINIDVFVVP